METNSKFENEKKFFAAINSLKQELGLHHKRKSCKDYASQDRRIELVKKIQLIVLETVESTMCFPGPTLNLKPRRSQWKVCRVNKRLIVKARKDTPSTVVKYTHQKKRFEIIFNLLAKIFRLLQTNGSMTKREIYYEHTELFGNQAAVNAALLDICSLLNATPWELRILTTSKGLVAGDLTLQTVDGEVLDCSKPGGVLVPQNIKEIVKIESRARFVLVVEKDAAFQKLLDDEAHIKYGPCILITGKGEPDMNTRLLVHRLSAELCVPVLIVVDADPYGIEIMCTYRFGSLVSCLLDGGQKCEIENLAALSPTFLTDMFLSYKVTARQVI